MGRALIKDPFEGLAGSSLDSHLGPECPIRLGTAGDGPALPAGDQMLARKAAQQWQQMLLSDKRVQGSRHDAEGKQLSSLPLAGATPR